MLLRLLYFEIKKIIYKSSIAFYFFFFFFLSFLISLIFADAFQDLTYHLGLSDKVFLNSSIAIQLIMTSIGFFGILIAAPIFGEPIHQEFKTGSWEIIFSSPLHKRTYFFIKFTSSFLTMITILSAIGVGIWFATWMPFINKELITENHFLFYFLPFISIILPNAFFFGALYFSIAVITHKISSVYLTSIGLFTIFLIAGILIDNNENSFIATLFDPFGSAGIYESTRNWSVYEQNNRIIPLTGNFLYNRCLFGTISLLILFLGYYLFQPFKYKKTKNKKFDGNIPCENQEISLQPKSSKILIGLSFSEFYQAFFNRQFLFILFCGVISLVVESLEIGKIFGTKVIPVTYHVLEGISNSFQLFFFIITSFYAGELIWKNREHHFYELMDSKPISNFFLYLSKLLSLLFIQLFLVLMVILTCLSIQIADGYYHFEWSVYFQHILYFFVPNIFIAIFSLFAHTISKNKHIGHLLLVSYCFLPVLLKSIGLDHPVYLIGNVPQIVYSDMNRFGNFFYLFSIFILYWSLFHLFIGYMTCIYWRRGVITENWKNCFKHLKSWNHRIHKRILTGSFFCWIGLGAFLLFNTNILNEYKSQSLELKKNAQYESKYKIFERNPHPEIIAVKANMDLYPKKREMKTKGFFKYKNRYSEPIEKILLNLPQEAQVLSLNWNKPFSLYRENKQEKVQIYQFSTPLQPNEEIELSFELNTKVKGFSNSDAKNKILQNGTFFLNIDYFPLIGYVPTREISNEKIRKKYKLPNRKIPNANDKDALKQTPFSHEGTWIDFEAIISTSKEQIAIAPGPLVRSWEEKDRKYFHYKMDKPILNFYAFLSGQYAITKDQWKDTEIEVYYHPTHTFNISRMIRAIKKSLEYYTENFSPYQYNLVRIVEFPRYETFAQSFPTTIPFSESLGFIAKVKDHDPECIDYVFYITSHEIAHQWWGYQLIGGNVPGVSMLLESLAQYSALMVQEKEYGPTKMQKFLKYELDQYLTGRRKASTQELPLVETIEQPHVHYNKGGLVFYALKDYLGEETVNRILSEFVQDTAFQNGTFARAKDLVDRIKEKTPEDLKYLIEDLFETVTFYENRTENVTFTEIDNQYEVIVESDNNKFRSSEFGKEYEIPMDDYIDVGVFDKEGNTLYLQKHKIKSGKNTFYLRVEKMPYKGGIDPFNKLIDKNSDRHLLKVVKNNAMASK